MFMRGLTFLTTLSLLLLPMSVANATSDHSQASFFYNKSDVLLNSGWSACEPGITWSVDESALPVSLKDKEVKRIKKAFKSWSKVSGLNFNYVGVNSMVYDKETHHLSSPKIPESNHIAVSFLPSNESVLFKDNVYGFAMPSLVFKESKTISSGVVVFKKEIVTAYSNVSPKILNSLYLHEIGHALGLGHSSNSKSIMFPKITPSMSISGKDARHLNFLTKPCVL